MQATLILWPVAYWWARDFSESQAVDAMLSHLARAYNGPRPKPAPMPPLDKSFGAPEYETTRPFGVARRAA